MAKDTTGDDATQGDATTQSHGDDSTAQGAAASDQGSSADEGSSEVATLQAQVVELLADNHRYRERERQRQSKPAKGDDQTDLAARISELETELQSERQTRQEQSLRLAAQTTATRLGYRNPELAFRLLDPKSIEYAPDGSPKNVEKLLTELAKAEAYLLAQTDFGGGQRGESAGQGGSDMNTLLRRAAGRS